MANIEKELITSLSKRVNTINILKGWRGIEFFDIRARQEWQVEVDFFFTSDLVIYYFKFLVKFFKRIDREIHEILSYVKIKGRREKWES